MKTCILLLLLIGLSGVLKAQTRARDGERFVRALNELAAHSRPADASTYTVDSTFHLVGDTLTYTLRYESDFFTGRRRHALPLDKVHSVGHDLNLVLYANDDAVRIYEQPAGSSGWTLRYDDNLILIGQVNEENKTHQKMKRKIEAAWQKLLRWYPPTS